MPGSTLEEDLKATATLQIASSAAGAQSALVEIRGLAKRYPVKGGAMVALAELDLDLHDGEFVGVVGPSGCGKSTLLNITAGLSPPSAGRVILAEREVRGPRADIGMMFQKPVLLPWRTALDNILLPVAIATERRPAPADRERAMDLIRMVGLEGFHNHYPKELSGGMAQRIAICRMLIRDPALLLMDEPFGALDELTRERLNSEFTNICAKTRKTVLFVTHSIAEAIFLSDRVLVMCPRPGRVVGILRVDLPKPRPADILTSAPFNELVSRARTLLNEAANGSG